MNCGRSLQGGLFVAGWEFRVGASGGGLLVRVFWLVVNCKVIPLVPTVASYGGSLLGGVLVASVGCF